MGRQPKYEYRVTQSEIREWLSDDSKRTYRDAVRRFYVNAAIMSRDEEDLVVDALAKSLRSRPAPPHVVNVATAQRGRRAYAEVLPPDLAPNEWNSETAVALRARYDRDRGKRISRGDADLARQLDGILEGHVLTYSPESHQFGLRLRTQADGDRIFA